MLSSMRCATVAVVLLGLAACGCGSGPSGRYAVSGTVSFKGQPLEYGTIEFVPATKEITSFQGAPITDGKFSIPADKGLMPGKYMVRVSSAEKTAQPSESIPGVAPPPAKDRIPPEYNENTKLTAEVTEKGPNTFDFKIQ